LSSPGGGGLSGSAGGFIGVSSLAGVRSGAVSVDHEPPHACKIKSKTKEKGNKYLRFILIYIITFYRFRSVTKITVRLPFVL